MKLPSPIEINLLEFFKSATFDHIKPGQTKKWILNNFADPDGYCEDFLAPAFRIWTYGNIEFHFQENNELTRIYSDYLEELDGGEWLCLNKWILEEHSKLSLSYVMMELNKQKINYCTSHDSFGVKVKLESGVELGFTNESDEEIDDTNNLHLNYFSLTYEER